jgi:hypothetical protein
MRFYVLLLTCCFFVKGNAQNLSKQSPDSVQIEHTITSFYKWYNNNWEKVNAFKLYNSKTGPEGPPYIVNWKGVKKYFTYLKKEAPQLHPEFYLAEREEFKRLQKGFDKNPQEAIAIGFDYDRFTNSQDEPQWFITELKKTAKWQIDYKTNTEAIITLWQSASDARGDYQYQLMCFDMKKTGKGWKIAAIYSCEDKLTD